MKKIELDIERCDNCPFCRHNDTYSFTYDSGYDCWNTINLKRIIDDSLMESEAIEIPDWCPLPNSKTEEDYSICRRCSKGNDSDADICYECLEEIQTNKEIN